MLHVHHATGGVCTAFCSCSVPYRTRLLDVFFLWNVGTVPFPALAGFCCYQIDNNNSNNGRRHPSIFFVLCSRFALARRRRQAATKEADSVPVLTVSDTQSFYVCSLSSRTITYKGQLSPEQVGLKCVPLWPRLSLLLVLPFFRFHHPVTILHL